MQFHIDKKIEGITVKDFLYKNLGFSSNMVKRLKSLPNGITVNQAHVTVRYILKANDILELYTDDSESNENIAPVKLPLDILYEDEYVILLNKPAGMPTHPSHNHHSDTLANSLAYYFDSAQRPFVFRAVNRLDADTSGIVLIAKDKNSAFKLAKSMCDGKIHKKYLALLHGSLDKNGEIELPIRRSNTSTMLRVIGTSADSGSKYALTRYEVIRELNGYTLVSASPITGRTHQLRVHFSHIGHPICGDGLYGITNDGSDYPRLALHAYSLTFPHPRGGELTITAPIPDDVDELFNKTIITKYTEGSINDN